MGNNSNTQTLRLNFFPNINSTNLKIGLHNIEILKNEGFLEREGTKGGYWVLHYIFP